MMDYKPPLALDGSANNLFGMLIYVFVNPASSQVLCLALEHERRLLFRHK